MTIIHEQSVEQYNQLEGVRSTTLRTLLTEGARAATSMHRGEWSIGESPAMRLGTAIHSLVLEGDDRPASYLTPAQRTHYSGIAKSLHDAKLWMRNISVYKSREVSVTGEIAGIPCKARVDLLHEESGAFADLKTTSSTVSLGPPYWYLIQCGFYSHLLRQNGLSGPCAIFAVKTSPPYTANEMVISESDMEGARRIVESIMKETTIEWWESEQHDHPRRKMLEMSPYSWAALEGIVKELS